MYFGFRSLSLVVPYRICLYQTNRMCRSMIHVLTHFVHGVGLNLITTRSGRKLRRYRRHVICTSKEHPLQYLNLKASGIQMPHCIDRRTRRFPACFVYIACARRSVQDGRTVPAGLARHPFPAEEVPSKKKVFERIMEHNVELSQTSCTRRYNISLSNSSDSMPWLQLMSI